MVSGEQNASDREINASIYTFSSVTAAPTDMPSSERAKEVFMGLGPVVGAMLYANMHTDFFWCSFFWLCSLLIEVNVASSETCPPAFLSGLLPFH